ncbi:MAG: hypothetical protein ACRD23_17810 [Terriglobales bacterium]
MSSSKASAPYVILSEISTFARECADEVEGPLGSAMTLPLLYGACGKFAVRIGHKQV